MEQVELARETNPVDQIECIASHNDWSFERSAEDEIAMAVSGVHADYNVSFCWMENLEALHLSCAFDASIPPSRFQEVVKLLSIVNGQVLMGHFDIWENENTIIFRQALLLSGGAEPTNQQVEVLLSSALETCETYFQAFQYVIWSGLEAKAAVNAVLFETVGEA